MIYPITTGPQTVTATGAVTGTLNTSAMSGDYELVVEVSGLSASAGTPVAVIDIEDTANSSAFSDTQVDFIPDHFYGPISALAPVRQSKKSYQLKGARFGAANTEFRCNVLALLGTSPSVTVNAFLVQGN